MLRFIRSSSVNRQAAFAACLPAALFLIVTSSASPAALASGLPGASSDYQASVESRLSDMEKTIRDMTGKLEKVEFENAQLKTKLDKALTDIDLRFQDVKGAGTGAGAGDAAGGSAGGLAAPMKQSGTLSANDMGGEIPASETTAETAPVVNPPSSGSAVRDLNAPAAQDSPTVKNLGTMTEAPGGAVIPPKAGDDPAGQYEMAFSLLKAGNYSSAKNGFETFIKTYPDHPLISNATYWLGESYYAEGQYDKAARIFAESYKKYPKGPKVADSLLKMGMSLGGAGKTKEACVTLQQLKKEFPTGAAVTLRRADQEMSRLGCAG